MSHTECKLFSDEGGEIWRRDPKELYGRGGGVAGDRPVATAHKGWHGEGLSGYPFVENARRLAACWNAFRGIPIEKIESHKQPEKDDLAFDSIVEMIACHQRDTCRDLCGELYKALRLAKDMFIANDMQIPHTFEVIDESIDKAEAIMGEKS